MKRLEERWLFWQERKHLLLLLSELLYELLLPLLLLVPQDSLDLYLLLSLLFFDPFFVRQLCSLVVL